MAEPEVYLRTQQVADALGIGVSTVKRWVDAGEIEASRTVGRHRLIPLTEALRFARTRGLPMAGLERAGGGLPKETATVEDRAPGRLVEALAEGRAREARRLIVSAHRAMGSAERLADELIAPAMARIGDAWASGALDIFHEHQASLIVAGAIGELIDGAGQRSESAAVVAVGASPEGSHFTLAGLLAELTLREVGWEVKNLGADLPFRSLTRAVSTYRPGLVFLTVGFIADPIAFIDGYRPFHEAAASAGAPVILGGRGLRPELRARLPHEAHGERMADLAAFGRTLLNGAGPAANTNH